MFDGWQNAKNGNNNDYAKFFNQTIDESNQILGKENGMTWAKYDLTATVKRVGMLRQLLCGPSEMKFRKVQPVY